MSFQNTFGPDGYGLLSFLEASTSMWYHLLVELSMPLKLKRKLKYFCVNLSAQRNWGQQSTIRCLEANARRLRPLQIRFLQHPRSRVRTSRSTTHPLIRGEIEIIPKIGILISKSFYHFYYSYFFYKFYQKQSILIHRKWHI